MHNSINYEILLLNIGCLIFGPCELKETARKQKRKGINVLASLVSLYVALNVQIKKNDLTQVSKKTGTTLIKCYTIFSINKYVYN